MVFSVEYLALNILNNQSKIFFFVFLTILIKIVLYIDKNDKTLWLKFYINDGMIKILIKLFVDFIIFNIIISFFYFISNFLSIIMLLNFMKIFISNLNHFYSKILQKPILILIN